MAKPTPIRTASGYQKYFDAKSLKNVASCAAIIFIIVHLVDYLWGFTIPLRILNVITLLLCLLITFLFVVNEMGRVDEKIILGVANAALLFFSVIGFNSTITSNVLVNTRNSAPENERNRKEKVSHLFTVLVADPQHASFFELFEVRSWMPSAEQEKKIDSLSKENNYLRRTNEINKDSLILLKHVTDSNSIPGIHTREIIPSSKNYALQIDSLKQRSLTLQAELLQCQSANHSTQNLPSTATKTTDTSFMDKANYISSYKVMKQKFEGDLKRCQQEADEYRSKYNILLRQSQSLMDKARSGTN